MKRVIFVVIAAALLGATWLISPRFIGLDPDATRELVITVLQTIPKTFLVLETHETVIVAHRNRGCWLRGTRRGQSTITVKIHGGVDLKEVVSSDICVSGHDVRIRLPPVQVLDTAPDLASWHYTGKRSGLWIIGDAVRGRSLEGDLLKDVERGIRRHTENYRFDRDAMVVRINRQADELFSGTGLSVRFE